MDLLNAHATRAMKDLEMSATALMSVWLEHTNVTLMPNVSQPLGDLNGARNDLTNLMMLTFASVTKGLKVIWNFRL